MVFRPRPPVASAFFRCCWWWSSDGSNPSLAGLFLFAQTCLVVRRVVKTNSARLGCSPADTEVNNKKKTRRKSGHKAVARGEGNELSCRGFGVNSFRPWAHRFKLGLFLGYPPRFLTNWDVVFFFFFVVAKKKGPRLWFAAAFR